MPPAKPKIRIKLKQVKPRTGFRKYSKPMPAVEGEVITDAAGTHISQAKTHAGRGNYIMAHHTLRDAFESGKVSRKAFENLVGDHFKQGYGEEAHQRVIAAADLAYAGLYSEAEKKLSELKADNIITEDVRLSIVSHIRGDANSPQRIYTGSKATDVSTVLAEGVRAETMAHEHLEQYELESLRKSIPEYEHITPQDFEEIKQELSDEYHRNEGEVSELIASLVNKDKYGITDLEKKSSQGKEALRGYGFPREVAMGDGTGALEMGLSRLAKKWKEER